MIEKENLDLIRNIFITCFLTGLIFLIIATMLYMPCKCYVANLYQSVFGISKDIYYLLWVGFIGVIKTILIFFFFMLSIPDITI